MNKKNYLILLLTLIVLAGIIFLGFFFNLPYLWIGGLILLLVTYVYLSSSSVCVKKFLSATSKYNDEEKLKKTHYFLSDRFKKSLKFTIFKDFNPGKIQSVHLASKNEISTFFTAKTDDGKEYGLNVIKRNPGLDGRDVFSWVIDDMSGYEFEKKYEEIHSDKK